MKLYRYIFYVLLRWANRKEKIDIAADTAFNAITLLVFSNVITFFVALYFFFDIDFISFSFKLGDINKLFYALPLIVISIPQYFYLMNKKRYLIIFEEFKNETKEKRKKGNIITTLYILVSLSCFFLTLYFGGLVFQSRNF